MKKSRAAVRFALSLVFCCGVAAAQTPQPKSSLLAGTAIPITFPNTLDAARLKVGDPVVTKTDQVILLPEGERIPRGSQLVGSVVEVQPAMSSIRSSNLAIKFETLKTRDRIYTVHVALRALASFVISSDSHSPAWDYGSLDSDLYRQVGGNYFFPDQTVYSNDWAAVGKSTRDGVFVKLSAGLVYGYKGQYEHRLAFNHHGFAPVVIPAFGWRYSNGTELQVDALGLSALMFQIAVPM